MNAEATASTACSSQSAGGTGAIRGTGRDPSSDVIITLYIRTASLVRSQSDASKAALFGLCRHVALEGAPRNIRANHVIPGPVDTPLGQVGDASVERRSKIRWPLGRQATAWDIAYATVFMLSGESAYITAQSLAVDGGITQFG